MANLWALADLHLSLSGEKPMEVFGDNWKDHAGRMARAWDRDVDPDDTVLLPGDLSWAMTLDRAAVDLEWIAERPGRKILLRGNHDYWWSGITKVRGALPSGCTALQNDAHVIDGRWVLVGARGWTAPGDPMAAAGDEKIFQRELQRLRLSLRDADRTFGRELPRVAMLHYPPWLRDREPTAVVEILREAGVRLCVFGHLHGADHAMAVTGDRDGIRYVLVAADAVDFAPLRVLP